MSDTPASIADEMTKADARLKVLADQYAWFKAQRDWWQGRLDFELSKVKATSRESATKAKETALYELDCDTVNVPWMNNTDYWLPDFVKICQAGFDLISKRYDYMESHLMVLMAKNKNVMVDYNNANSMRRN